MKQEIKDKWLKALKSGDYVQASGKLKTSKGHCCLGVLAEVMGEEISECGIRLKKEDNIFYINGLMYNPLFTGISNNVIEELYKANDDSYYEGVRDYSRVIPIIEERIIKQEIKEDFKE